MTVETLILLKCLDTG